MSLDAIKRHLRRAGVSIPALDTVIDLHKSDGAGATVTAARLTVRVQRVDATEFGSHAVAEARNDVEARIPARQPNPTEVIGQVDKAVHSSFAASLFKVIESLQIVVEVLDKTAKVCIS